MSLGPGSTQPLNIFVVTDEWSPDVVGGVGRVAAETSRRLAERGHSVTVIAPRSAARRGETFEDGVRVIRAVARGRLPQTLTDVSRFARVLAHGDASAADVVIAHQVTTSAAVLRARLSAPLVYVFHASGWREAALKRDRASVLLPLLRLLERRTTRGAAAIVALSSYSADLLGGDRPDARRKVSVIPGGVDADVFAPGDGRRAARRRLGLGEQERLAVSVRRLEPTLGLEQVLDALTHLDGFELALVGDGSLREALQDRAAQLGITQRVRFAGRVAPPELVDWYRAADVYVQPPAPHEGFGLGILEALSTGTPAAGAAVGAVPELLQPLDERLVAPTTGPRDLAAAVEAAAELNADVREYAVGNFSWARILDRWQHLLSRLVAGHRHRRDVLGAPLDPLTLADCLAAVDEAVEQRRTLVHTAVNAAKVVRLQDDDDLRRALWSADISTADGQAVVWAARTLGSPVPERVAGIDLMEALAEHAERRGYSLYLLGAREHVVEAVAAELRRRHSGIKIAGYRDGYFPPDNDAEVAAAVAETQPDILFVALETPRKELFLAEQRQALGVPFAMGVGGAFDVLAGEKERAPRWAQRLGLEWAFRMAQDPRRLAARYLRGNVAFVHLLLTALVRGERAR